jgi:hypothetical protein
VTNEAELLFMGLTISYPPSKRVLAGLNAEVDLEIVAADDAKETQIQVNLTITSEGSTTDPALERSVTSGAEWTVVVEPSIASQLRENLPIIIPSLIILVVLLVVFVVIRKKKRAKAVEEDLDEGDEDSDLEDEDED